eukprot:scaffold3498_cov176-Amphora_coffeaeformis.AAC.4
MADAGVNESVFVGCKKKGGFYVSAEWIDYEVPDYIQQNYIQQKEVDDVSHLFSLFRYDLEFAEKLNSLKDHLTAMQNEVHGDHADFEIGQSNQYVRNLWWIDKDKREPLPGTIPERIHAGMDAAHVR